MTTRNTSLSCPSCSSNEVVRAEVGLNNNSGGRCLVRGHRFRLTNQEFAALREPVLGG